MDLYFFVSLTYTARKLTTSIMHAALTAACRLPGACCRLSLAAGLAAAGSALQQATSRICDVGDRLLDSRLGRLSHILRARFVQHFQS